MLNPAKELIKFLQIGSRINLKFAALETILGLTGTPEGIQLLIELDELIVALISLLSDNNLEIARRSVLILVNISANENGAERLLSVDRSAGNTPPLQKPPDHIVNTVLKWIFTENDDENSIEIANLSCMILSNLTHLNHRLNDIVDLIQSSESYTIDKIVKLFDKRTNRNDRAKLDYLASTFSNLTQNSRVRQLILDENDELIKYLLPYIDYEESQIKQTGVIGTIRNCCFETQSHSYLLNDNVNLLPYLLLPLAGNEEFDDEDNDKLPIELQYLDATKKRLESAENRLMLIEILVQLCTEKANREFIREKNSYVILRELHKWEQNKRVLLACENLVNILIRTEDEIGRNNLNDVEVPQHLVEEFHKDDEEFINS